MTASPHALYRAWTDRFDAWFAAPGLVQMRAAVGEPFVFQTKYQGALHTHYGRFLNLLPDRLVEMTWMTGGEGTAGAETVVRVEFEARSPGTRLRLTHSGFYDEAGVRRHDQAWERHVLPHLDEVLRNEE